MPMRPILQRPVSWSKRSADSKSDAAARVVLLIHRIGIPEIGAQPFVGEIEDVQRDLRLERDLFELVTGRKIPLEALHTDQLSHRDAVLVWAGRRRGVT